MVDDVVMDDKVDQFISIMIWVHKVCSVPIEIHCQKIPSRGDTIAINYMHVMQVYSSRAEIEMNHIHGA